MSKIKLVELITTEREVEFKNAICRSVAIMQEQELEVEIQYSNIGEFFSALVLGKETEKTPRIEKAVNRDTKKANKG